jgi:hypothetical protein
MSRRAAHALCAALAGVAVAVGAAAWDSRPAASQPGAVPAERTFSVSGEIRVELVFRDVVNGRFTATGATSDSGRFGHTRRVAGKTLEQTLVLTGRRGRLVIRTRRPCAAGRGSWRVMSGSGAYAGFSGRGRSSGGPRCVRPTYPVRAVLIGTARPPEPPAPPADAGSFGGATATRGEVRFDVAADGRSLRNLRISRIGASCTPPTATPFESSIFLTGPFEIPQDGSFSIRNTSATQTATVMGRFTSRRSAVGQATSSSTFTSSGTTHTCTGTVDWTAVTPPPTAQPGRYCGASVCLDVSADGMSVSRIEVGVVVSDCRPEGRFEITLVFADARIGANLGFAKSAQSFEGLVSGSGSVSGFFDPGGTASGRASLVFVTFDHENNRYTCRRASSDWNARRQS